MVVINAAAWACLLALAGLGLWPRLDWLGAWQGLAAILALAGLAWLAELEGRPARPKPTTTATKGGADGQKQPAPPGQ